MVAVFATLLPAVTATAAPTEVVANGDNSGTGSLRRAIEDVDPGGTITIPASVGEIALDTELVIDKSLTIEGAGLAQTAIDAQHHSRAMLLFGTPDVTVSGVQILDGEIAVEGGAEVRRGGAILVNGGKLILDHDLLVSNVVDTSVGGHSGNAEGGAIASLLGTELTLRDTTVSDNVTRGGITGDASGGGIAAHGALTVEGGQLEANNAEGALDQGGGIYFEGPRLRLVGLAVMGNGDEPLGAEGASAYGGGIDLAGFSENLISGVTVAENVADGNGTSSSAEGTAVGGGLNAFGSETTIVNSTIVDNTVSTEVDQGGHAIGGGLVIAGPTKILNSTIAGNLSQASGTFLLALGGDVYTDAPLAFENSIVAAGTINGEPGNCATASAEISSEGHNIDSLDDCNFRKPGDHVDTDPGLRPLAENGGPVETMALEPGSPAIDGGAAQACPETDARGGLRPVGKACDIGAFQVAMPIATTEPAAAVGPTGATLTGIATNPDLAPGSVSFQYGTSTDYGSTTVLQAIGPTTRDAAVAAEATGLAPATTYHFRILVQNAVGTAEGPDRTFTTAAVAGQGPAGPGPTGTAKATPPHPRLTVRHLGGLRFRLRCGPVAFHGKLLVTAVLGRRRPPVGHKKLNLRADHTKVVTLKLDPLGRRLAARPGSLPLVVKAVGAGESSPAKPVHFILR